MFFFYIKKKLNTEYKHQKQFAFSTCTLTEANSPRISRIWSDTSKKNINRHVHVRIKQLGTIKYCRIKKKNSDNTPLYYGRLFPEVQYLTKSHVARDL